MELLVKPHLTAMECSVTSHMRPHSVTCHPTQMNTPHLNPSQTGQCQMSMSKVNLYSAFS